MGKTSDDDDTGGVEVGADGKPVTPPEKRRPGRPKGAKNKPKQPVAAKSEAPVTSQTPAVTPEPIVQPPPQSVTPQPAPDSAPGCTRRMVRRG